MAFFRIKCPYTESKNQIFFTFATEKSIQKKLWLQNTICSHHFFLRSRGEDKIEQQSLPLNLPHVHRGVSKLLVVEGSTGVFKRKFQFRGLQTPNAPKDPGAQSRELAIFQISTRVSYFFPSPDLGSLTQPSLKVALLIA